jgi:putative Holliday junction resolvase
MIIKNLQEFYQLLTARQPIISIDYGAKKMGIAISNQERSIAMPLFVVKQPAEKDKINSILNLLKTYSLCGIVIGWPISMNGVENSQTLEVHNFAVNLSKAINLPIYLQDERLTSMAANSLLKSFGIKRKERNKHDDVIAASMILETTLNSISRLETIQQDD